MSTLPRLALPQGLDGCASAAALAACSTSTQTPAGGAASPGRIFGTGPAVTPTRWQRVVEKALTAGRPGWTWAARWSRRGSTTTRFPAR